MSGFTVKNPSLQSSLCHLLQVGTWWFASEIPLHKVNERYWISCDLCIRRGVLSWGKVAFFFFYEMALKSQLMLKQFLSICFLIHWKKKICWLLGHQIQDHISFVFFFTDSLLFLTVNFHGTDHLPSLHC